MKRKGTKKREAEGMRDEEEEWERVVGRSLDNNKAFGIYVRRCHSVVHYFVWVNIHFRSQHNIQNKVC